MPPHPGLLYRLRSTTKYDEHPKEKVYQFVRLISWHFSDASWSSDVKLRRDARICRATSRLVSVAACPESILDSKIKQKNNIIVACPWWKAAQACKNIKMAAYSAWTVFSEGPARAKLHKNLLLVAWRLGSHHTGNRTTAVGDGWPLHGSGSIPWARGKALP